MRPMSGIIGTPPVLDLSPFQPLELVLAHAQIPFHPQAARHWRSGLALVNIDCCHSNAVYLLHQHPRSSPGPM